MPNAYAYSNLAIQTTLTGSINSSQTTMTVGATTGFPSSFPYSLAVDFEAATEELVKVTGAAGSTLTVERGFSGTSAQSHSLGAVVRHVFHAGDATDFRTHEAATATVHGVSGALVGTSDVQTLDNKTLNSPIIASGGSMSGTFGGTPTFSGAVTLAGGGSLSGTFSGTPVLSGGLTLERAGATDNALQVRMTGDAAPRAAIVAGGAITFGDGTNPADVAMNRDSASSLKLEDRFFVERSPADADCLAVRVTGDTNSRFLVEADGAVSFGSGSGVQDVFIRRTGASALSVTGNISATNFPGVWSDYTPTWVAEGGSRSIGNGSLAGRWTRVGTTVFFTIRLDWGSTTSATDDANWTFALPVAPSSVNGNTWQPVNGWVYNSSGDARFVVQAYVNATDTTVRTIVAHADTDAIDSTAMYTLSAPNNTSIQPVKQNFGNGDRLNIWGFYEAAS
jgi:hypothetical protein